jgi:choline dehydrogenase
MFASRVRANQEWLRTHLKPAYDFIVCGSGSSGSVVARRLAENPDVAVLLLEAGGADDLPTIRDADRWAENLGSACDWAFPTRASRHLNGRSLTCSMGKVLGGSSSINGMIWSRGHRNDWDGFADAAADAAWGYDAVLDIYRRIEDWQGEPDAQRRGAGGLVFVQPAPDPAPGAAAMVAAAGAAGIPSFVDQNGCMMEGDGGAALSNLRIRDGRRLSIFRSYVYPWMDRPNLTVVSDALVTRLVFAGGRATAVEVAIDGGMHRFQVGHEVVLSLGAVHTPKLLMQSGIGDREHLRALGIETVEHLPGVGRNLQAHVLVGGCVWEYQAAGGRRGGCGEATCFWKSDDRLDTPDLQYCFIDGTLLSPELRQRSPFGACCSITPCVVRPRSRGQIRLTGAGPSDPVDIDANILSDPADVRAAMQCLRLGREIGNAEPFRSLTKTEAVPGPLGESELEDFIRNATVPFWHCAGSARMGRDAMSVVDGDLRVYGTEGLRIADASIMPNVTTGNTMAPCVIIGERAAALIRTTHAVS